MKVTFLHPDLGIGGAERLIVDFSLSLNQLQYLTHIFTSYHSSSHCFQETLDGSLNVQVVGDSLPSQLFHKGKAIFAYLRQVVVVGYLLVNGWDCDLFVLDQVSVGIPILKWFGFKVLFYCHYPDLLLSEREGWLKKVYRYPIDSLESWATSQADIILVNSKFTLDVVKKTFPKLSQDKLQVLYPGINTQLYQKLKKEQITSELLQLQGGKDVIVSINRFERKKNINLAIYAFKQLQTKLNPTQFENLRLIIAGGYDPNNLENVHHLQELVELAQSLSLTTFTKLKTETEPTPHSTQVLFLPSFDEVQRSFLLFQSKLLIYTPQGEHFGIVPVESMYCNLPVIAIDSAGPKETILNEETGYLVPPDPVQLADKLVKLLTHPNLCTNMGKAGRLRVQHHFTLTTFQTKLHEIITTMVAQEDPQQDPLLWFSRFTFTFLVFFFTAPFIFYEFCFNELIE